MENLHENPNVAVPRIVESATMAPGQCWILGTNEGPFFDTGKNVKRYGRVYISLKALQSVLDYAGYLTLEEAGEVLAEAESVRERLHDQTMWGHTLQDAIRDLIDDVVVDETAIAAEIEVSE